jgi:regulator of ribonuclease activity A
MSVADICDQFGSDVRVVLPGLHSYGGKPAFSGVIETVRVDEDNTLVRETLSSPGSGRVLVVDGGGKTVALVGDRLATLAIDNGWEGVVVNGYVRDTAVLSALQIGVVALGTFPRRSFDKRAAEVSVPVNFLGVDFVPGEWISVDVDGAIVSAVELTPDGDS